MLNSLAGLDLCIDSRSRSGGGGGGINGRRFRVRRLGVGRCVVTGSAERTAFSVAVGVGSPGGRRTRTTIEARAARLRRFSLVEAGALCATLLRVVGHGKREDERFLVGTRVVPGEQLLKMED